MGAQHARRFAQFRRNDGEPALREADGIDFNMKGAVAAEFSNYAAGQEIDILEVPKYS